MRKSLWCDYLFDWSVKQEWCYRLVVVCSEVSINFAGQADLQQYILQTFAVSYSQPGISALCSRKAVRLILDNAGAHHALDLQHQHISLEFLPPTVLNSTRWNGFSRR